MEHKSAVFDGAFICTDAVNIVCDKISWKCRQKHIGHKQSLTAQI